MIQRPTGADMPVYAALSTMRQQPTQDEIANGVIPLDTLPANWWNWLWNTITKAQNDLQYNDEVIFTEINNVLAAGGITPNPTADAQATHDQLIRAINVIKNAVATTTTLGVVKSSDTGTDGSVRVNTGGTMTVNGFGDLATLHTVDKSTITGAINEVHDEMDALNNDLTQEIQSEAAEIRGEIGTLSSLTTSAKGSTVAAINELQSEIGTLSSLTTSAKGSTVAAINELQSEVNTNKTSIGTLSSLTTSAKGSTVAAINELQSEVNTRLPFHVTTMMSGRFVSSSGGYISLQDFWTKMVENFGLRAEVVFSWENSRAGYVSLDGTARTDRIYMNGVTVIYNCNGTPNGTYASFQAMVIPGGGTTDTYVMMANTSNTAGTLSLKRITRLANANEVGALSSLTTTDKSSIVAAINELKSGVSNMITVIDPYNAGHAYQFYGVRASTLGNILLWMMPTKISYGILPNGRKMFAVESRIYNKTIFTNADTLYINPSSALVEFMSRMDNYGIDTPAANTSTLWTYGLEQKLSNIDNAANGVIGTGIITVNSNRDTWPAMGAFGGMPFLAYLYAITIE